jgi:hypothetical protein
MKKYIALGGTLVAAALTAVAIAVWPASETDKARADGERLGAAVNQLSVDLDYIIDEAADFRSKGPQVNRPFWDGFESGVNS